MLVVACLQYIVIVSEQKGFLRVFSLDPPLPGMSVYVGSPLIDFESPFASLPLECRASA